MAEPMPPTRFVSFSIDGQDRYGAATDVMTKGRHDPCVGIRAVPVGEAMVACVLADHFLRHRGQNGEGAHWPFVPLADDRSGG